MASFLARTEISRQAAQAMPATDASIAWWSGDGSATAETGWSGTLAGKSAETATTLALMNAMMETIILATDAISFVKLRKAGIAQEERLGRLECSLRVLINTRRMATQQQLFTCPQTDLEQVLHQLLLSRTQSIRGLAKALCSTFQEIQLTLFQAALA
jgi:hypothetical protein